MKATRKSKGGVATDPKGKMVAEPKPSKVYAGGDSNVVKEAGERDRFKKGGKVCNVEGKKADMRADRAPRHADLSDMTVAPRPSRAGASDCTRTGRFGKPRSPLPMAPAQGTSSEHGGCPGEGGKLLAGVDLVRQAVELT